MISGMRTAVAFRKLQRFLGMRALGSKVTLNARARTCAEIKFVWPRMDFRCAGRSAENTLLAAKGGCICTPLTPPESATEY